MKLSGRLLTVVAAVSWVAMLTALFLVGSFTWPWWIAAFAFVAAWLGARVVSRDLAEKPARDVDEYELVTRTRARNAGYWLALFTLTGLSVLFYYFAEQAKTGNIDLLLLAPGSLIAAALAIGALPTLIVACTTRATDE